MLNRLRMNHAGTRPLETPLAYGLLFSGIAIAVALFIAMQSLNQQNAVLLSHISQLQQPVDADRRTNIKLTADQQEEMTAVRSVIAELSMPWEPLFRTLEALNSADIKLAAMEPIPRQHKLRLTAEASAISSMLLYVEKMARQPIFKDVVLVTHEQTATGMMPIRFVIEAAWIP